MSLAGVVLSGGRSARMGTPKALLDFRGQPFVVRILEVLEAEKVQLQEAVKKKITVSPVEVDKRINGMMQDYHFTLDQLRQSHRQHRCL